MYRSAYLPGGRGGRGWVGLRPEDEAFTDPSLVIMGLHISSHYVSIPY
jgi:hypothetical protein